MVRSAPVTHGDLATVRQAQEQFGSKVAHDIRELRQRIDQVPTLAHDRLEAIALDLNGARSEIATLRTNTTKMRDELAANTAALRKDLAEFGAVLTSLREKHGTMSEAAAKSGERLMVGLTRIASQVSDSETVLSDSLLNARSQLASLRGDVVSEASELGQKINNLPEEIGIIRAEVRTQIRASEQGLILFMQAQATAAEVRAQAGDSVITEQIDTLAAWLRRPRWWQWRRWFGRAAPEPAPELAPAPVCADPPT